MTGQKKQRVPRVRKRVPVRFGTSLSGPSSVGFTVNISARGVCISAPSVHPAGSRLQFELKLPGEELCVVIGTVAWSMRGIAALTVPGTMGVRIESTDEKFFRFLAQISPPSQPPRADSGAYRRVASQPVARAVTGSIRPVTAPAGPAVRTRVVIPPPPGNVPELRPVTVPGLELPPMIPAAAAVTAPPVPVAANAPAEVTRRLSTAAQIAPVPRVASAPDPAFPMPEWWHSPVDEEEAEAVDRTMRASRHRVRLPVRFGTTQPLSEEGITENLSRTGFAITCRTPLSPGTPVFFAVAFSADQTCHGNGLVTWTRLGRDNERGQTIMGIRFVRVDESYRKALDSLRHPR